MEKNLSLTGKLRVTNMKKMKQHARLLLALVVLFLSITTNVFAQSRAITGVVTDAVNGESLIGVSIVIKGTTIGAVSDIKGNFTLEANSGDVLLFSFIGYLDKELTVSNETEIKVEMDVDLVGLDEVVVIGYGTQKKKLNTGATVNVKGEDIEKLNTATPMDALKGLSPGVTITQNNGVPGSGSKVLIRGAGTIDNSGPLYVVDGVTVGDIDFLSPSDIESIDVLKDAASSAIYGSRAANGVILVTTKKGAAKGSPTITYDFYHGWQSIYKMPELLNAQQYIEIMDEGNTNSGITLTDWETEVPNYNDILSGANKGTNWVDQIYNENAPVVSHALSVTGGNDGTIYSLGFSSFKQEGVLGKDVNNVYKRINIRLNSEHVIIRKGNDKPLLKLGENLNYSNFNKPTIRTGNIYWNDLHNMLVASPLLPMYADDVPGNTDYTADPYYYGTVVLGTNPVATMELESKNNYNSNNSIVGNAYLDLEPVKNLVFRSSFGINSWFGESRSWKPIYDLGPRTTATRDQVNQSMHLGYSYTFTNTIAYKFDVSSVHNFAAVLGQETQKNQMSLSMSGHNEESIFQDYEHAYLDNTPIIDPTYTTVNGKDDYGWGMLSYFGRVSYDYKETFLATAVLRADGSSRFPKENRWGTFPSVSVGYIMTNHSYMQGIPGLNYLKLRGSWGQNGNENIASYQYLSTLSYDEAEYFFGQDKTFRHLGAYPARVPNPDITWETSEQTSLGFDANFLNNKLQFNFDWYQKITKDWLVDAPALSTNGTSSPYINGGEISNKGIEMALRWNEIRGEFSYGATATFAYNQNEVTAIANEEGIIHGQASVLSQGTSEMYRAEVGYPIGYFWGFKTDGILQNDEEVEAWLAPNGNPYFNNVAPGDMRFVNQNGDSLINDEDKVMIGDPHPDFVFGFQFDAEYKGLYFLISANGAAGHQIAKSYRSFNDSPRNNYTTDIYGRWHGEGTSNTMPRLLGSSHRNTQYISDLYIEDGDYLRINNITIGYDINRLWSKSPLKQMRVYFTGKNLVTFTKYSGMDPEVGYGPDSWSSGIDLGLYPASKTYMVGLNVIF